MSSKPKTYRCLNKDCQHLKQKKYAKPLAKGHIEGKSFIIVRCNFCHVDRGINVTKEEAPKKIDIPVSEVAKLLMAKK